MRSPNSASPFLQVLSRLFRSDVRSSSSLIPAEKPGILVLDEDAAVREVIRADLQRLGYRVDAVASAAEALARMRLHVPVLLIADANTARKGRGLFLSLSEDSTFAGIPVVLIHGTAEQQDSPMQTGNPGTGNPVVLELHKPFDSHQLAQAIQNASPLSGDDPY